MKAWRIGLGAVMVASLALNVVLWRARNEEVDREALVEPWRAEIKRLKKNIEVREAQDAAAAKTRRDTEFASALAAAKHEPLPGFKPVEQWTNAGTFSPVFSLETHCWAIANHDAAVLLRTFYLTGAQRVRLTAAFDRLRLEERTRFGSPERMLAICWAESVLNFTAFRLIDEEIDSPTTMTLKGQLQSGLASEDRVWRYFRAPDGWRREVPDNILESMLRRGGITP